MSEPLGKVGETGLERRAACCPLCSSWAHRPPVLQSRMKPFFPTLLSCLPAWGTAWRRDWSCPRAVLRVTAPRGSSRLCCWATSNAAPLAGSPPGAGDLPTSTSASAPPGPVRPRHAVPRKRWRAAPCSFRIKTAVQRAPALCQVCLANLLAVILSRCTAALQGTLFFLRASVETEAPSGEGLPWGLRARPERLSVPSGPQKGSPSRRAACSPPWGSRQALCCKTCLLLCAVTPSVREWEF